MVTATPARKMRTFQSAAQPEQNDLWYSPLPLDVMWGIYARQSTPAQLINNVESTEMQTEDLIQWLLGRGVLDGSWRLFDADLGVSGTLRIDQRTGLQELVELIKADLIKAVLVYQISRLFRDDTGVQYNTFAEICKQHNCVLVTSDGMVFNFNNRMHLKMFRFLAEYAAEYIPQQIGLLHAARLRKARKGLYAGLGAIPVGFIVDRRVTIIVDGQEKPNPTYKKVIPYEPHASVIRYIFRRYFELDGNLLALRKELCNMLVLFPHFGQEVDQRTVSRCLLRKVPGGYHLSRLGLTQLLTNPVYLGWWIVKGDVISQENHPPILGREEEYLFWYAFHRLSEYTTTGEKNQERETIRDPQRYYQKTTCEQRGVLKDKITSPLGSVHVHIAHRTYHYCIVPPTATTLIHSGYLEIEARDIDREFTSRFFERLEETHDFDAFRQWVAEVIHRQDTLIDTITIQLKEVEKQQEAIVDDRLAIRVHIKEQVQNALTLDPTADREKLKAHFEKEAEPDLERLRKRAIKYDNLEKELRAKLPTAEEQQEVEKVRKFADFQTEVKKLIPVWDKKPFSVRQEFVNLFVQEAVLEIVATHWIRLDIYWRHPAWGVDTFYIYRNRGVCPEWSDEEKDVLRTLYPTAPKEELLSLLPDKSWGAIAKEAHDLGIERYAKREGVIPWTVSWSDWQFAKAMGIEPHERSTICVSSSGRYCHSRLSYTPNSLYSQDMCYYHSYASL